MAREMKDSGVAWIGEIPSEWETVKLKYFSHIDSGESISKEEYDNDGEFPVVGANGEIGRTRKTNNDDEVITTGRVGTIGTTHIFSKSWITDNVLIIRSQERIFLKYLSYVISCFDFKQMTAGTAMPLITATKLLNQSIPFPELFCQRRIADFLDAECARIDAVIEQTRASIEEYKKLKQSVITDTVTKGIRPGRKMKDSGIEWIGEIPEEWDCRKFKYIAKVKSNLVSPDDYGDYPQVSPENIEKDSGRLLPSKTVSEVGVISGNHLFHKGQILYSKIRPMLNKVILAPFDGLCSADMYPIETSINDRFFIYAMRSDAFLTNIALITEDRVKMPKINQEELGEIQFAIPPDSEQVEIADYMDKATVNIDLLVIKKERLLGELQNYRKSLIFEYVTGKKEAV